MSIWRWAAEIDFVPEAHRITLGEGDTPLVRSRHIGPSCGLENLYFKLDFANRLTEILAPADREAFDRALRQLTERSAQLVAEVAQGEGNAVEEEDDT